MEFLEFLRCLDFFLIFWGFFGKGGGGFNLIWICFGIFAAEHYKWPKICKKHHTNRAKAISAELLDLNLKNKLENGQINNMKREKTGRNRNTGRRKHQKTEENG